MGQMIDFKRPDGSVCRGYLASVGQGRPGVVVIQEWWGLNDQICGIADRFARAGYNAQSFTTIELKSNHLGTVSEGSIACLATAQHLGRNTQVWDAVVTDEANGKKIALFRCTQMVLWPKA